jgi:uncharacterized protein (TIGR02757 family)
MKRSELAVCLEELYTRFNDRRFVAPDPLEIVLQTTDAAEAEVAGFIAATLSYGRVASILNSTRDVLRRMNGSPRSFLLESQTANWTGLLKGFVYRWSDAGEMLDLWHGLRRVLLTHGSLESAFRLAWSADHPTVLPALTGLVESLGVRNSLVPDPTSGGAAKRLHMFLRWMIRRDTVDPGLWRGFLSRQLLMPLDVHSFRQCRRLGLTRRRQPNLASVEEITRSLARLRPDDPVRYDFALSRLGIRDIARLRENGLATG